MQHDFFTNIETIRIWSDGGPHHFRVSANMWILTQLQQHFQCFFFIYNFFIAYHGHSVCDAAASHGKKQVTTIRRNQQRPVSSPAILVEVLNTIDKHLAFSAQAQDKDFA